MLRNIKKLIINGFELSLDYCEPGRNVCNQTFSAFFWLKMAQNREILSDRAYISNLNFATYGAVIHNIWFRRLCRYSAGSNNSIPII